jgi:hypothetical protein
MLAIPNFTALESELILAFLILAWLAAALWALAHQTRRSCHLSFSPTPPASAAAACKLLPPASPTEIS